MVFAGDKPDTAEAIAITHTRAAPDTHTGKHTHTPIHTVRKFHEMSQGGGKGRVNNANLNKHRLPSAMWVCLICVSHVCVCVCIMCVSVCVGG